MINPVILFVPVSSDKGVGEYTRSAIIADALQYRLPGAKIHFILNRNMKLAADCPYTTHLSDHSATKDTPLVNRIISKIKPDLVIFDCAGRAKQFAHAKRSGAKVIFISQHKKKRARGLSFRRLLFCDLQWVVQPDFAISPLTTIEKLKLKLSGKPAPKNIGAILPAAADASSVLNKYSLKADDYILFSAGSGGHELHGELATDTFYRAAIMVSQQVQCRVVVAFGSNYPNPLPASEQTLNILSTPSDEFLVLLQHAKARVLSAGSTLLQVIEMRKPSVAVAVSKDQPVRLEKCRELGLVLAADCRDVDIAEKTLRSMEQTSAQALVERMESINPTDGVAQALAGIESLLGITTAGLETKSY